MVDNSFRVLPLFWFHDDNEFLLAKIVSLNTILILPICNMQPLLSSFAVNSVPFHESCEEDIAGPFPIVHKDCS